jgi:formamidase
MLPTAAAAVPAKPPIAEEGLRTIPPRENCGNADVKQLTRGSKLYVPVAVDGALYSVGDGHFAQGDAECCGTAIEMGATAVVRFKIHKDLARTKNIAWPRFSHPNYFAKVEQNFIATMGMPVTPEGRQENGDLNLAARNAVIRMIELLEERGWTREQAYVLCSVAVDLRVSNLVDMPNVTVSAFLPEDIFR